MAVTFIGAGRVSALAWGRLWDGQQLSLTRARSGCDHDGDGQDVRKGDL